MMSRCALRFSPNEHGPAQESDLKTESRGVYGDSDFLSSTLMSTASAAASGMAMLRRAITTNKDRIARANAAALVAT
jgi:hypothetical protein